jgi:hypothetical protein
MGIIQSLDVKKFSNFGDLAIFYLKHLSMLFQSAETIVPRKLINSCLFLLFDKNFFQSGMLLPSFT